MWETNYIDPKVASSHAKINENFANSFIKTKDKVNWFFVLKCTGLSYKKVNLNEKLLNIAVSAVEKLPKVANSLRC